MSKNKLKYLMGEDVQLKRLSFQLLKREFLRLLTSSLPGVDFVSRKEARKHTRATEIENPKL